jgi:hypothetical protein
VKERKAVSPKAPAVPSLVVALTLLAVCVSPVGCERSAGLPPEKLARLRLADLHMLIMTFHAKNERYPAADEIKDAAKVNAWTDSMFVDPWKRRYTYRMPGRAGAPFDLCSLGPDGKADTEDDICVLNPGAEGVREFGPVPPRAGP